MKHILTILSILFCFYQNAFLQCLPGSADAVHYGNEVRARITNNGILFVQEDGEEPGFEVPYQGPNSPSSLFSAGLWMGATTPSDELRVSAASRITNQTQFAPGPIDLENEPNSNTCSNWDQIFKVHDYEILAHLNDYATDLVIDNPLDAIYGWPARGNPHFFDLHGFDLPNVPYQLAPFYDQNGNNIYEPEDGDYPAIPGYSPIPTQTTYTLFNDASNILSAVGMPLNMEVHQVTWNYYCPEEDPSNHMIFTSHRFVSKGLDSLLNTRVGFMLKPQLGCPSDDYFGTDADLSTVYFYNSDNWDGNPNVGDCPDEVPFYGENPPVQAVTCLNYPLYKTVVFHDPEVTNPPFPTTDPLVDSEYYQFLNGQWKNGNPITNGGIGFDPDGEPKDFMYPGDPSISADWSMFSTPPPNYRRRMLFSIDLGSLSPGESRAVDMVWSFCRDEGNSHLENIGYMQSVITEIKSYLIDFFDDICCAPPSCTEDCVWAGDTNRDGTVDQADLLSLGVANGAAGPERESLINWAPWSAEEWLGVLPNGTNLKHVDTNGDGLITPNDQLPLEEHYDLKTPWHQSAASYPQGLNLYWEPVASTNTFTELSPGEEVYAQLFLHPVSNLYGLSFTLEVDQNYFSNVDVIDLAPCVGECLRINKSKLSTDLPNKHEIDIAITKRDGITNLSDFFSLVISAKLHSTYSSPLSSNTTSFRLRDLVGIDHLGNPIELGVIDPILTIPIIEVSNSKEEIRESLHVSPNPSSGSFTLTSNSGPIDEVMLYTLDGQEIPVKIQVSGQQLNLQVLDPKPGMYLLAIPMKEQIHYEKIIIQ